MTAVEEPPITETAAAEPETPPKKRVSPKLEAALEAARAADEPDADDDEPDAAPEPDEPAPTPAPVGPPTEADLEAIAAAVEAETERHMDALMVALGPLAADYDLCYSCVGRGAIDRNAAGNMPAEQLAAIKLQTEGPEEYNDDPEFEACARCSGKGWLRTKSLEENQKRAPCPDCDNRGWNRVFAPPNPAEFYVPNSPPLPPSAPVVATIPPPPPPVNVPPPGWLGPASPGADAWGRWPGHSRYGIDPANGGW